VNTRQVATGTVLSASLLLGGAGLADARPNPGAMDRGMVPSCERLENRMDGLRENLDRLDRREARLTTAIAEAHEAGHHRQARVLTAHRAKVRRAQARLTSMLEQVEEQHAANCEEPSNS
jgi:hypothetical protein